MNNTFCTEDIHLHPLLSVETGSLLNESIMCVYTFFRTKIGQKESKSKNAADAEKFVDDDIIPSPECNGSVCAGEPGITV